MSAVFVSLLAYAGFLATFLYAIGFVGGFGVSRTVDGPGAFRALQALPLDAALLGLFALQHSVMARPAFKRAWTRICPPHLERSVYVLATSLALGLLFRFWRPVPGVVWEAGPALAAFAWTLHVLGWAVVLLSTFMISHAELFGLRQAWLHARSRPYTSLPFQVRWFYALVRHPLMLGFILAFWATPRMTAGHLFFSAMTTAYILVALRFEEADLRRALGDAYRAYQARVPMLLPLGKGLRILSREGN